MSGICIEREAVCRLNTGRARRETDFISAPSPARWAYPKQNRRIAVIRRERIPLSSMHIDLAVR